MKIELVRQTFNEIRSYKFKPFRYCCDKIKGSESIVFSDEACPSDDGEYAFPAFALCHTEHITEWEDEYEEMTYSKIDYCPFCGEAIEISVVAEENVDEIYDSLVKERKRLWKVCNQADSKKKEEKLRRQVRELDRRIESFYVLSEYGL